MSRFYSSLDGVRVAAPCPASWDEMIGDEQVRFCNQCSLNVYNLSGMSKKEAESLIARTEGRLCIRFYRRADGAILTSNCPVGLRAIRRRLSRVTRAIISTVLSFFAGLGIYAGLSGREPSGSSREVMGVMVAPKPEPPSLAKPDSYTLGQMEIEQGQVKIDRSSSKLRKYVRR